MALRRDYVVKRLAQIASEHKVAVLYACESGSRAWGFASKDSDYDVRFLYLRPRAWYIDVLKTKRDVLDKKDGLPCDSTWDISGWDLKKALGLLQNSSPQLMEWLNSPIVYYECPGFIDEMREVVRDCFSLRASLYHYRSMAMSNYSTYLLRSEIEYKKYLYVLRPLFACSWALRFDESPPLNFARLMASMTLPDAVRRAVVDLWKAKRAGSERMIGKEIPVLNDYIEKALVTLSGELEVVAADETPVDEERRLARLNELLHKSCLRLVGWDAV